MATPTRLTLDAATPGLWGAVRFVVLRSGKSPGKEFFDGECEQIHVKGNRQATAKVKFLVLFQKMANDGPEAMPRRHFKKEMGHLWAFTHEIGNVQIRLPCFRDGDAWLITTGFKKKGAKKGLGKWRQEDIDRAEAVESEYRQRKAAITKDSTRNR
jgi:hypothetical protein